MGFLYSIGAIDGGPQSSMSILRNSNVLCLCYLFPPKSHVQSKQRVHPMELYFLPPMSHITLPYVALSMLRVTDHSICRPWFDSPRCLLNRITLPSQPHILIILKIQHRGNINCRFHIEFSTCSNLRRCSVCVKLQVVKNRLMT